jgi:hypothetical protein
MDVLDVRVGLTVEGRGKTTDPFGDRGRSPAQGERERSGPTGVVDRIEVGVEDGSTGRGCDGRPGQESDPEGRHR